MLSDCGYFVCLRTRFDDYTMCPHLCWTYMPLSLRICADGQEERMLRQKTNERFLDFVKRCEEACPAVKTTFKAFDAPYRALKFTGMCCARVYVCSCVAQLLSLCSVYRMRYSWFGSPFSVFQLLYSRTASQSLIFPHVLMFSSFLSLSHFLLLSLSRPIFARPSQVGPASRWWI